VWRFRSGSWCNLNDQTIDNARLNFSTWDVLAKTAQISSMFLSVAAIYYKLAGA
jgi:hypothetical protein